jgi:para-aminobenzoate synthetase component 1
MTAPLVAELVPAPDPAAACGTLAGLPHMVFLDSAGGRPDDARFSFLCADPVALAVGPGAVATARAWVRAFAAEPVPWLPPFQGGAAGFVGYDWGATLERVPPHRCDDLHLPVAQLGLYDWVVAWEHAAGRAWVVSTGLAPGRGATPERAAERLRGVLRRLRGAAAAPAGSRDHRSVAGGSWPTHAVPDLPQVRSTFATGSYLHAVRRALAYIAAGDVYQVNLSQRLELPLPGAPLAFYQRLRRANPAPFGAFLAGEDFALLSASPERFLRVEPDGTVLTRPVKGTRPRGATPAADAALAHELLTSSKERAENVMIVDLLRNDLGRVCAWGSVRVPELVALETHPSVHHLVSTVTGRLAPGQDAVDVLRAAFPGGSVTGAPKIRAMEILAELEPTARGPYCGTIGYLSRTGAMDTNIVIRTCVVRGGRAYLQVGGGVVADSDPEQEYAETLAKARGVVAALTDAERAAGAPAAA